MSTADITCDAVLTVLNTLQVHEGGTFIRTMENWASLKLFISQSTASHIPSKNSSRR